MKIFQQEIDDGLKKQIIEHTSIANLIPISKQPLIKNKEVLKKLSDNFKVAQAASVDFDLYPLYTILTTSGWNGNTDVFDITETTNARNTPIDKPFNLEHDSRKVIGHITGSWITDADYHVIENPDKSKLPEKIHLLTSAVLYKSHPEKDETLYEEMQQIIAEIEKGEWYVSMEVLFKGFDYAVVEPNGTQYVVERNHSTAFLTKHLTMYGGTGSYKGNKLGRLMRDLIFSGKGLVKVPANSESVILNGVAPFSESASLKTELPSFSQKNLSGELSMAEGNDKMVAKLEEQNASLQSRISDLTSRLEKLGEDQVRKEIDGLNSSVEAKATALAELQKKFDEQTTSFNETTQKNEEITSAKAEVEKTLEDTKKELDEAKANLAEKEAEARKSGRKSALITKGFEEAIASEIVEKFDDLDDDKFDTVVKLAKPAEASGTSKKEEEDEVDENGEATAGKTSLEAPQEENSDASLTSDTSSEDGLESAVASTKKYFMQLLGGKKQEEGDK